MGMSGLRKVMPLNMANTSPPFQIASPATHQSLNRDRLCRMAFAGGFTFDAGIFKVTSSNITPDSATGIGAWNHERFMNKFTMYRDEKNFNFDPGKQNTFMPLIAYAGMKDEDLSAIFAYLKSLKPIKP